MIGTRAGAGAEVGAVAVAVAAVAAAVAVGSIGSVAGCGERRRWHWRWRWSDAAATAAIEYRHCFELKLRISGCCCSRHEEARAALLGRGDESSNDSKHDSSTDASHCQDALRLSQG